MRAGTADKGDQELTDAEIETIAQTPTIQIGQESTGQPSGDPADSWENEPQDDHPRENQSEELHRKNPNSAVTRPRWPKARELRCSHKIKDQPARCAPAFTIRLAAVAQKDLG